MSAGIDATVVLGLAGKAATVFAEPGTYLSFPLGPVGYEAKRFQALVNDPLSADGQQMLTEFSLLVNEVPDGPLWQPDGDHRLWDVYGDVLAHSQLADTPPRGPAEEQRYQAAFAVLYVTHDDGTVVDSPTVETYEQCRDAYNTAAYEYNNRKGTDDEAALKAQVDEALQDWTAVGKRAEVEEARRVLREESSRSPVLVWADYRKLYDPETPEIFFRTSPDGSTYVPTGYLPSDVVDSAWPTITATRDELTALAASAPAELRSRLGSSEGPAVESVSFEYSTVTISRPWFAPEVFASRAWRFREERVLSDGATPPKGECTAYVSGVVLARNITVRTTAKAEAPPDLGFIPVVKLADPTIVHARPYRRPLRLPVREAPVATPGTRRIPLTRLRPERVVMSAAEPVQPARPLQRDLMIRAVAGRRLVQFPPPRPIPEPPAETTTTTTSDPNEVYVIAFVCRALPQAPNPDPNLTWS